MLGAATEMSAGGAVEICDGSVTSKTTSTVSGLSTIGTLWTRRMA